MRYDDTETLIYSQGSCLFVRNGECEIPPCSSCFIDNCGLRREEKEGQA